MLQKVFGLAFMLGLLVAACGGEEFSTIDFEPGYCAAGNGGAPDSPDDCPAGAGGQAGNTNNGGAAGNKAGAAGQTGKAGAAGGSSGAGGKCCAGAGGTSGQAGAGQAGIAGSAGSSAGASGQAGSSGAGGGGQPPSCGNGIIEAGETCEGSNFNGATCATLKGPGWTGTLTCNNCLVSNNSCVAPPPSCLGGQMKTPTTMTVDAFNAGTSGLTAYELRYDGGKTYDNVSPIEIDLMVNNGPRILVATGFNGIDAKLLNAAVAHPLYNADMTNVSECQGALVKTQGCDHKIAKDLWCTLHANEQSNCSITTIFASLSSVKMYVVGNPGNTKVAWDVRCMP